MDDNMEISSEHGHNTRDEDIDIDIDLTAGHDDEDYVLEDAVSHQAFDEDFQFQASPTAVNDDLMVDEDGDEAYDMDQINTNTIPDDSSQNMADESFTATNGPASSYMEAREALDADQFEVASVIETEVTWDSKEAANGSAVETDLRVQSQEEPTILEDEDHIGKVNTAEVEPSSAPPANTDPQPTSSHDRSPKAPAVSDHSKTPSDTTPKPTDENTQQIVSRGDLDTSASHEYEEEVHSESEETYPTEDSHVPLIPDISVLYQETEYALFSTSELDDPDSFFLSDTSILDSPISHFLKAIRDVIHGDLADEDELCLSMGDLGIDVEESSTLIQDTTLRQIFELYEGLLRNDGVESPRPFCIQFGVRPNFSKRLANLAAGAAVGKGLADLISWTDLSTSRAASAGEAENTHGEDASKEEPEQEEFDDVVKDHEDVQDDADIPHELVPGTDLKSPTAAASPSDKSTVEENLDSTTQTSPKVESLQTANGSGNDNYDEDDLIDYSDEELDEQEKSNAVIYGEPQEESVVHAAGDSLPEQSATQSTAQSEALEVGDDGQDEELEVEFENGVEYDEDNDRAYYPETDVHEDGPETSIGNNAVNSGEHEGNGLLPEPQHGLKLDGKGQDIEQDKYLEDEIEYDDDLDAETQDIPKLSDEDLGLEGSLENPIGDDLAGSLEFGSTATPTNGTNDKTLGVSTIIDEDEIDYDDDDEPSVPEASAPVPSSNEVPVPLDGSGKRQRDFADLDEGTSMTSQEPKRLKS